VRVQNTPYDVFKSSDKLEKISGYNNPNGKKNDFKMIKLKNE